MVDIETVEYFGQDVFRGGIYPLQIFFTHRSAKLHPSEPRSYVYD